MGHALAARRPPPHRISPHEPVGGNEASPTFLGGIAFGDGCFLFAAFAAGLAQNRYTPG